MNEDGQGNRIEFKIDKNEIYREESFTDLKVGAIRRLTPIKSDGGDDEDRKPIFIGNSQIMSPEGPLPIQVQIKVNTFEEALDLAGRIEAKQTLFTHIEEYWNRSHDDYLALEAMFHNVCFAFDGMRVGV